ncbi:PD-(D/E)XK nuclease family protein [Halopiger djelfimassiliensis]|uniref:PD-(D/E)XK nuclease family protein n=1 Tax=Halopiger djelfimassiliensis TaxID=1293047 RepID=UPI000678254D|nr:PD-(D/E)XK nuclease family protein [Halopiger djelfimassiliensis]
MTDATERSPESAAGRSVSVDGLATYLRCPRRYEFAHVHELEGSDDSDVTADRADLLRRAICAALRSGETDVDGLFAVGRERLSALWDDHDERFHSRAQRRHERRVLEATLRAYLERVGVEHAAGIERLAADATDAEPVGPSLSVSSTVSVPENTDPVPVEATVDYLYVDGSSFVGVRFVPTLAPLGLLRYRSDWDGDVADLFTDHFDADADVFEPGAVSALLETAVVLEGLRARRDRLGLEDRTCRYLRIPLADRSKATVNWIRGTVETSLEVMDLTDVYVDHLTYGMTHEHRNETVDDRLADVLGRLVTGSFDPSDRWDRIESHACPSCEYTVCCQEYIAREVAFDG